MSFLYPFGLLGLIAVPLLILIYILKNKHTEQVISSTYLWRLSERFLKKKNPISRLTGIISLILQILAVTLISFAIAHPVFTLPNAADDYVFILDASGSMQYVKDGRSRYSLAKEEIEEIINDSANGSTYTLINAGDTTGVVFENVTEKMQAVALLSEAEISATAPNFADARGRAQEYFAANPASRIYLVTDKSYEALENVTLVQVSSREENYAVSDLKYSVKPNADGEPMLVVSGNAYSYESDRALDLVLEVRESGKAPLLLEQSVQATKLVEAPFTFEMENVPFTSLKVTVQNQDALPQDNQTMVYNVSRTENNGILIVSEDPFFLKSALTTIVGTQAVTTLKPTDYDGSQLGYELYVFESYSPDLLPSSGAVWFVNPQSSVKDAGFTVQEETTLETHDVLEYSKSSATRVQEILKDTNRGDISVKQFVRCGFYRSFHTVLSYGGNPVLFAGTNSHKNRQVVFAFDFHQSDFILQFNYLVLMRNLLEYTFPAIVKETSPYCGEFVSINVLTNCSSVRVEAPSGKIDSFEPESDLVEYVLTEVGVYKITQMVDNKPYVAYVYGNLPKEERASLVNDSSFEISGTPSEERRDGKYDDLLVLLIILAAVLVADWMVYCYEQRQLR